ncbi:hypothetical protein CDQ84_13910 [Clostridium thermosuccinogenes]|jgi:uncharacterized protein YqhQ|uniref:Metal-dependent enzyme n=1 Tax=Clostridium thermosuccinogenes TaxID=84032 RepID=A0A2K2FED9_9CLOT|nr:DUF1385 domain-containing protein [Pseudoclostridium thermosuccinogenes]AUS98330.1 hypothetical protein CDO33_18835 [Pseudoclostridium thermosuccinogenes]PNT91021.1 hypothetical protein CDQ83_14455 [Pseudoclostridium thermosuccinogenes]PNT95817.1 hypothetical protein CDQ85_13780 [Pseudoclostridium thermosuccinogenes]PNT97135.1 hypothetical protein CDQ84_13910 [Pseudoclostridium thermosuccinogenes]
MKKTSIGGQALIEGILMLGPENAAIAVRKPDGEIVIDKKPLPKKNWLSKVPVVRGVVNFVKQIVFGMKALMYSAEFYDVEEEQVKPSKFEKFIEKLLGNKFKDAAIYAAVVVAIAFSVGLFVLLPNFLATLIGFKNPVAYNLFEGVVRIVIFFLYLKLASMMKDIQRVWEYHGAEHKTIHCYEHGEELTVENVSKYSTKHPRCGTSFMFLVMIVSILVFSVVPLGNIWFNVLTRLALVPLVAGLSYEVLKFAGRSEWKIMKIINAPGMLFQIFTTREPDAKQIEVAIAAFNNVLVPDKDADNW